MADEATSMVVEHRPASRADDLICALQRPLVEVQVQVGENQFNATAQPVTDPQRIADFIELRSCAATP